MASNVNQVAPGAPSRADVALLESLRARLMSLVFTLEKMKNDLIVNQTAPPNWLSIQQSIAAISNTINGIQTFMNKDPETAATFHALHSFPIPPFPLNDPKFVGLADTIFQKAPGAQENDWILAKLAKAAEFAHVPGDWNIEAKRPIEEGEEEEEEEGSVGVRRQKALLDEDELAELWKDVHDIVEEQATIAGNAVAAGGESGGESGDESEEMEDVVGTGAPAQAAASAPASVTTVAQPMMSLKTIHKFMATGAVA